MSKYIPGNQKHLSPEDRKYIERSLNSGTSFKDIAKFLCKDPTTISKEVKLHRLSDWYHKGTFYNAHNFCIHRYHCRKTNVCGKIILCNINVLHPFLFEVVRHIFLPVFQLPAVEAVFQDMADGGVMPQALPHRREVAVFFKPLLDLLAAVSRKVHIEDLPDRFRLRLVDDIFRPHLVVAKHVPGAVNYAILEGDHLPRLHAHGGLFRFVLREGRHDKGSRQNLP